MIISYNHVCALTTVWCLTKMVSNRNIINGEGKKIYWTHLQKISDQNKYPIRLCKMLACQDDFVLFCFVFSVCVNKLYNVTSVPYCQAISTTHAPPPPKMNSFSCSYVYIYIDTQKQPYKKQNTFSIPVSVLVFAGCTS